MQHTSPTRARSDTAATTLHLHSLWKPRDNATVSLAVTPPHTLQQAAGPCQQTCNPLVCHPTTNKQTPSSLCVSVQPTSSPYYTGVCAGPTTYCQVAQTSHVHEGAPSNPRKRAQALRDPFTCSWRKAPAARPRARMLRTFLLHAMWP
jgi:hypothetical protein